MCWGRGSCPNSKCNQELIWTDGQKVTYRASSRYQLWDRLSQGRVSLTITQAVAEDAGTYCCRIEHKGWFNDEKINVRLTVEKAPTTVRTTTTTTTTKKTTTTATTTLKTTPPPTTLKATTTPPPVQTTPEPSIPLTTPVEETTQLPPSTSSTSPPPLIRTETPSSLTARTITPSIIVSPDGTTEGTDMISRSSDVPEFIPDHDLTTFADSKPEEQEHTHTPSLWPESLPPSYNGMSDLLQGNVTALHTKDKSTLVIAISVSVFALIVICAILLQLKVRKQGQYPLGLDPHLELVTHAEETMTEIQAEAKEPSTAKWDTTKTNHIGNINDD
ncbi:T-cell immunoglobulin and mucin domain-containing protein 4-like isoform X2 [Dendropsophus ebraccatus]